ncbi:MAG: MMPL family transporter [Myxococcaceae bacterium]|nr:MMPL family transporter [Myxococcaceae bacterium]
MSTDKAAFITRWAEAWARLIVKRPGAVLVTLVLLGIGAGYASSKLSLESDQLKLISQELPEVKDVQRIIDMVGGAGYLMMGLRGEDEKQLKELSDKLNERLLAEKENVRFITYKVPVDFIQENMVLFLQPEDLAEGKKRINAYLKDQMKRASPFYVEIRKTEPVQLDLKDLIAKYDKIGKKSVRDDYYISEDRKMILMLIKPMWNSTELQKTSDYIEHLTGWNVHEGMGKQPKPDSVLGKIAAESKLELSEQYDRNKTPAANAVFYGFTGSYKTGVDDSYAIQESLDDVLFWALGLIVGITVLFFRKWAPTLIAITGMALGTLLVMGFAYITLEKLNMVTSIIAAILMGFGIDYGIHFIYRTRIELGTGKRYDDAISAALVNAGRPALIAAIVTSGSFLMLYFSEFRGFSQFGVLAGFGTMITGFTMFAWSPAILALCGRLNPELPAKLIGTMTPVAVSKETGKEAAIPKPKLMLAVVTTLVMVVCLAAVPKNSAPTPKGLPSVWERFMGGVHFNYNTRALVAEDRPSFVLQDEITERFNISADPVAIAVNTPEEVKELWDELTTHPDKYPTIDQVVSVYSFIPPRERAEQNAKILEEWDEELKDIEVSSFPPEMQEKGEMFKRILKKKPYDVEGVPEYYQALFTHLPTTKPENRGYLLFIYPAVDLWDGAKMLAFKDQVREIKTASGKTYRSAGLTILYAKLAEMVLFDGKFTVILAALWILLMHYLDFRSVPLAAASVIPLGVGLWMMMGLMALTPDAFFGRLNFMNLVILPILLGFGVSHGLYLLHRFLEGTSPVVALRSVGAAVASSTLTAIAGFASLFFASHKGLQSIGYVACLGLATTLVVSFTVLAAVLQIMHDRRKALAPAAAPAAADAPAPPPGPANPSPAP